MRSIDGFRQVQQKTENYQSRDAWARAPIPLSAMWMSRGRMLLTTSPILRRRSGLIF
ncbi:hypothetical protein [Polaromonas sp.]|uniref:hypothetical protein n=1 Tax=Polaromonas sp. TaxID=1869339 RepID=UPI00352B1A31